MKFSILIWAIKFSFWKDLGEKKLELGKNLPFTSPLLLLVSEGVQKKQPSKMYRKAQKRINPNLKPTHLYTITVLELWGFFGFFSPFRWKNLCCLFLFINFPLSICSRKKQNHWVCGPIWFSIPLWKSHLFTLRMKNQVYEEILAFCHVLYHMGSFHYVESMWRRGPSWTNVLHFPILNP